MSYFVENRVDYGSVERAAAECVLFCKRYGETELCDEWCPFRSICDMVVKKTLAEQIPATMTATELAEMIHGEEQDAG